MLNTKEMCASVHQTIKRFEVIDPSANCIKKVDAYS